MAEQTEPNAVTDAMESLRRRLARWRREHGGRGRRIPVWVWEEAAMIARTHGVAETARALRLAPHRLEAFLGGETDSASGPFDQRFVELAAEELGGLGGVSVELEGWPDSPRIRVRGGNTEAVAQVAASLWKAVRR